MLGDVQLLVLGLGQACDSSCRKCVPTAVFPIVNSGDLQPHPGEEDRGTIRRERAEPVLRK